MPDPNPATAVDASQKMRVPVLVTGDVVLDWTLFALSDASITSAFDIREGVTLDFQNGGAGLLSSLLEEVAKVDPALAGIRVLGPGRIEHEGDPKRWVHSNAFELVRRFPLSTDKNDKDALGKNVHRIDRFLGFRKGTISGAWPPDKAESEKAALVIVADGNLRFREQPSEWPQLSADGTKRPWTILKTQDPLVAANDWATFKEDRQEKLITLVAANELRADDLHISRTQSWERTAQDVLAELRRTRHVNKLLDAAHLVVLFPMAGAMPRHQDLDDDGRSPKLDMRACLRPVGRRGGMGAKTSWPDVRLQHLHARGARASRPAAPPRRRCQTKAYRAPQGASDRASGDATDAQDGDLDSGFPCCRLGERIHAEL
jgi:hypothetical protein